MSYQIRIPDDLSEKAALRLRRVSGESDAVRAGGKASSPWHSSFLRGRVEVLMDAAKRRGTRTLMLKVMHNGHWRRLEVSHNIEMALGFEELRFSFAEKAGCLSSPEDRICAGILAELDKYWLFDDQFQCKGYVLFVDADASTQSASFEARRDDTLVITSSLFIPGK